MVATICKSAVSSVRSAAAGRDAAVGLAEAEQRGGHAGDGGQRGGQVAAGAGDQVAQRGVEAEQAAGQAAIGQARALAVHDDLVVAQGVAAGGFAERGHGVGDQAEMGGALGAPGQRDRVGVQVDAVGDQAGGYAGHGEQGAGQAGRAMVERRHGVEQVRAVGDARREPGARLLGRGHRVARADEHAPRHERLDQAERAG